MKKPIIIQGGNHQDSRGRIVFANDFDMSAVKRMYHIHQTDTRVIRAWQGHKFENKWFHCIKGSFLVKTIAIDNWESPNLEKPESTFELIANNNQVLHIPGGYANGFKALDEDSILLVLSDVSLAESQADDIRIDADYWKVKW